MNPEIPYAVMIGEITNEIKMRERVYDGLVAKGKMKQADANKKIRIMQAVIEELEILRKQALQARLSM